MRILLPTIKHSRFYIDEIQRLKVVNSAVFKEDSAFPLFGPTLAATKTKAFSWPAVQRPPTLPAAPKRSLEGHSICNSASFPNLHLRMWTTIFHRAPNRRHLVVERVNYSLPQIVDLRLRC